MNTLDRQHRIESDDKLRRLRTMAQRAIAGSNPGTKERNLANAVLRVVDEG